VQFVCRIGTPDGRVLEEIFQARDESDLRADLQRRGFHLFEARSRGLRVGGWLPWRAHRQKIPSRVFLVFNQELAALLKAGLPLLQTLDLMLERLQHAHFRTVLTDIRDRVRSGTDLSEAFAAHPGLFPPLYAPSLKAGERTGELEQVIRRFVRYMKLVLDARRRVIGALVYPTVLVGLSLAMLAIMATFVVPKFADFFLGMGVQLPLITRLALGLSQSLQRWWPGVLFATLATSVLTRRWAASAAGRQTVDRWRLSVPIVGKVFRGFALSEFTRALSTLLAGGIPLVQALEIAVSAVGNLFVRRRLEPSIGEVREGRPFHGAIEKTRLFDSLEVDMIKVGESTGSLDAMLQSVSEFLDEQTETRVQRLLTLIEPLLLVFMGILIATLLIAIYVPLFSTVGQNTF